MANGRIEAKVARVIPPSDLAINGGTDLGVKLGDEVTVYEKYDIEDPVSGERLGGVIYSRLHLKVNLVSKQFSIARVTDRRPVFSGLGSGFAGLTSALPQLVRLTEDPDDENAGVVLVQSGANVYVEAARSADDERPESGAAPNVTEGSSETDSEQDSLSS